MGVPSSTQIRTNFETLFSFLRSVEPNSFNKTQLYFKQNFFFVSLLPSTIVVIIVVLQFTMNCNSNPRDLAFKRNYRCSSPSTMMVMMTATTPPSSSSNRRQKLPFMVLLTLLISSTAGAFSGSSPVAKKTFATSSSSISRLTLFPNGETSNTKHNNKQQQETTASVLGVSTLQRGGMLADVAPARHTTPVGSKLVDFCSARAPGVLISVALAHLSAGLGKSALGTHVSPLLWATILGMAYGNLLQNPEAKKSLATGIKFSKGRLLRLGIILYGFKITLQQIAGIGLAGLATDVVMVCSTLALGIGLGTKWLGLDRSTSTLIASGAAICGCSAVLATQPVVGGESHEVSAAVGTVVLGGTLSMFLYPFLYKLVPFLAASPKLMGIYTGSTIHEIAGVVAAGNAMGGDVAFTAVVTKLARVLLLAPVLTTLSWMQNRKCFQEAAQNGVPANKCKLVLPWFAFGFVAVSAMNSVVSFPTALVKLASKTSAFSLLCAMAALGIDSDFKAIRRLGSNPLLLAGILWTWLAVGGLGMARFFVGV